MKSEGEGRLLLRATDAPHNQRQQFHSKLDMICRQCRVGRLSALLFTVES